MPHSVHDHSSPEARVKIPWHREIETMLVYTRNSICIYSNFNRYIVYYLFNLATKFQQLILSALLTRCREEWPIRRRCGRRHISAVYFPRDERGGSTTGYTRGPIRYRFLPADIIPTEVHGSKRRIRITCYVSLSFNF